jgi:atlastin
MLMLKARVFGKPEKSLKVVYKSGDGYKFDRKALKDLLVKDERMAGRFIVPISIAGPMRTGKSFLFGIVLQYLRAQYVKGDISNWLGENSNERFEFKHGIGERHTEGIHVWKEVFFYDSPNGEKLAILLIDTQGVFDPVSSQKDNNVIFATSCLMSSVQINNVMKNINENDYQNLQQFAAFGKVAIEDSGRAPFQKLLFLVRDSPPADGVGLEGGQRLLEQRSKIIADHQLCRNQINAAFEKIECFLLPNPGCDVEEPDYDGNLEVTRAQFKKELLNLIPHVFAPHNLIAKEINGRKIGANEFINFLDAFINFFNSDKSPTPQNLMEVTATAINLQAVLDGFEKYMELFKGIDQGINSLDCFDDIHRDIVKKVFEEFDQKTKFGGKELSIEHRNNLQSQIDKLHKPFREEISRKLETNDGPVDGEFIGKLFLGKLREIIEGIVEGIEKCFKAIGDAIGDVVNKVKNIFENLF